MTDSWRDDLGEVARMGKFLGSGGGDLTADQWERAREHARRSAKLNRGRMTERAKRVTLVRTPWDGGPVE